MPSPIQRVPVGALDLLGLKGSGYTAAVLPDVLQPTINFERLYTVSREEVGNSLTNNVSVYGFWGMTFEGTVPQGKLWITSGGTVTLDAVLPAGTTYRVSPAVSDGVLGRVAWCGPEQLLTTGETCCIPYPPLIVKAGCIFGVYCSRVTLGTAQGFRCNVPYVELDF